MPEVPRRDQYRTSLSFENSILALAIQGLPQERLDHVIRDALGTCGSIVLGIENEDYELHHISSETSSRLSTESMSDHAIYKTSYKDCAGTQWDGKVGEDTWEQPESINLTRDLLFQLLTRLWRSGLGRDRTQKILASVLHNLMTRFVEWAYAGIYDGESEVVTHLKFWVENVFARFVVQVLNVLRNTDDSSADSTQSSVDLSDMRKWQEMAISRLGVLRVGELFDIVVDWDQSKNGIRDLKHYTTNPATRAYLTNRFVGTLTARLLHPGASTIEILQLYISIIRAFRELDPRGVLLDRVARPIRKYLREREDAVKVVVGGLLSDVPGEDSEASNPDVLSELAIELNEQSLVMQADDEGELDWNNMEWVPDPIDAAPDYKKSRNSDVIGSLISLLETKEVFVKEFQVSLADRLLQPGRGFEQETKVIEHLKLRFGDQALQACDVMLRDVTDSRRLDSAIRQEKLLETQGDEQKVTTDIPTITDSSLPALHAKILSRLFWPPLLDQPYNVPEPILALQHRYQAGFSAVKQSRKLTWLNHLGHVTVELDLEDRVVMEEALPWQATVIYAFQESPSSAAAGPAVSKTVDELASTLNLAPTLVRSACIFWLAKRVLIASGPDTYTVLEKLPVSTSPASEAPMANQATTTSTQPPTAPSSSAAATAVAAAAVAQASTSTALSSTLHQAQLDRMATYRPFVVSMLTNQGSLPLPRIAMMLGLVVPGGFPYRNEELKEFLGRLVGEGVVEVAVGGVYRVVK